MEKKGQAAGRGHHNRHRMKRAHEKALLRKRAEREAKHVYDRGVMRRALLRGLNNILKRLMFHVSGFSLGVLIRDLFGSGTPMVQQAQIFALVFVAFALPRVVTREIDRFLAIIADDCPRDLLILRNDERLRSGEKACYSTNC